MSRILYVAEGEIEERFINFLKQHEFIPAGRFAKFNLMQDRLKDTSGILTKKVSKIYCILDTDIVNEENISNLIFNVKKLTEICPHDIFNLVQNKNFEDELRYILDYHDLGKLFNLPHNTTKDLKKYLAQTIKYENYISDKNLIKYCSRSECFKEALKGIQQSIYKLKIISAREIMEKK